MKIVILLTSFLGLALSSLAQSQNEMNAEAARDAARADKELNQVYKQVLARLDEEGAKLLKASQRAWLAYRDADAALAADEARGGSMSPMLYSGTIAQLTGERTAILRQRMGGLEGSVTSDSDPAPEPEREPERPVRRAEPLADSKAVAGQPAGAKTQGQAAQQFFDAYKAHNRAGAQAVAAEAALKKLLWKASAGDNATLKLMDNTHIYYEGGSIELKMQKNAAGRWFVADVGLYAD